MFGIGTGELLLMALIALLVLGPERMPKLMRDVGKTVGDLRKTSEELRGELLNADQAIRKEVSLEPQAKTESKAVEAGAVMGATQAAVVTPVEPPPAPEAETPAAEVVTEPAPEAAPEPEETDFDREAREARERLEDPARATPEGWRIPTDEAGTSAREG